MFFFNLKGSMTDILFFNCFNVIGKMGHVVPEINTEVWQMQNFVIFSSSFRDFSASLSSSPRKKSLFISWWYHGPASVADFSHWITVYWFIYMPPLYYSMFLTVGTVSHLFLYSGYLAWWLAYGRYPKSA